MQTCSSAEMEKESQSQMPHLWVLQHTDVQSQFHPNPINPVANPSAVCGVFSNISSVRRLLYAKDRTHNCQVGRYRSRSSSRPRLLPLTLSLKPKASTAQSRHEFHVHASPRSARKRVPGPSSRSSSSTGTGSCAEGESFLRITTWAWIASLSLVALSSSLSI